MMRNFNSCSWRRSKLRNRTGWGGSVKIKSQGWKIPCTLRGSLSAVSTPIFASKYSLESSSRDLQDLHAFAPLRPQYFNKIWSFFSVFNIINAKKFAFFIVAIFADVNEICSDSLENAVKRCNFSKFLYFNLIV